MACDRRRLLRAGRLFVAVVLTGVAAGLIGILMAHLLEFFESVFYGAGEGSLLERVERAPLWRRVLAPAAGGAIAGALWWWERSTGGVVPVEAAIADLSGGSRRRMGIARPFLDGTLQVLTVGAGNSVGREGAPRLMAGAVAARLIDPLMITGLWGPALMASAAGAGLAAMYNTPLGGAAYAVEIMLGAGNRRRGLLLAVPVSLVATMVSWMHSRGRPTFQMPQAAPSWWTPAVMVALVPVLVALGVGARTGWKWLRDHRLPDTWTLPVGLGAAGALTGALSLGLPMLPGNGKDAMAVALDSPATGAALAALVAIVVLKPVATGLTLGAGATGGLLAPSFALGGSAGAAVAGLANLAGAQVSVAALALVGASTVLGVTQRAPVFGVLFVWELARGPLWTLAAMSLMAGAAWWLTTALPTGMRRRRRDGAQAAQASRRPGPQGGPAVAG